MDSVERVAEAWGVAPDYERTLSQLERLARDVLTGALGAQSPEVVKLAKGTLGLLNVWGLDAAAAATEELTERVTP